MDRRTTFLAPIGILLLSFVLAGCPNGSLLDLLRDREPPVPGGEGNLQVTALSWDTLQVSWNSATDDNTPAADLEYRLYCATENTLETFDEAEQSAVASTIWAEGDTAEVDGLVRSTPYWVNVFVRDRAGNIAAYKQLDGATLMGPVAQVRLTQVTHEGVTTYPDLIIQNLDENPVDFGTLARFASSIIAEFTIFNNGDMDLILEGTAPFPEIYSENWNVFSLSVDIAQMDAVIPKEGGSVVFEVEAYNDDYSGAPRTENGSITFYCNDPDNSTYKFGLTAQSC